MELVREMLVLMLSGRKMKTRFYYIQALAFLDLPVYFKP